MRNLVIFFVCVAFLPGCYASIDSRRGGVAVGMAVPGAPVYVAPYGHSHTPRGYHYREEYERERRRLSRQELYRSWKDEAERRAAETDAARRDARRHHWNRW